MTCKIDLIKTVVVTAVIDAARLLHRFAEDRRAEKKAHWSAEGDAGFGSVVTKWDLFIQDYISARIKIVEGTITCFGEENGCVLSGNILDKRFSLIIDPIDGTEWFKSGDDDYSVLASIMHQGVVLWAIGAFPQKDRVLIGDGSHVLASKFIKSELSFQEVKSTNGSERCIAAHYRLGRGSFKKGYDSLKNANWSIMMNGDGFGTNLSATEKYIKGEIAAFIAPKMSVVDGFPTAMIIKSAGGCLEFFDSSSDIDKWNRVDDWHYIDFGSDIGKRTRFIAAKDPNTLRELKNTLDIRGVNK